MNPLQYSLRLPWVSDDGTCIKPEKNVKNNGLKPLFTYPQACINLDRLKKRLKKTISHH